MLVCFVITAISGMLFLFFPKGPRAGWYEIGSFNKGDLNTLPKYFGILMILFVLIHFLLHLKWIVTMTKNLFKKEQLF
jgi:cytochrome b subunit of formate dehydrogenase